MCGRIPAKWKCVGKTDPIERGLRPNRIARFGRVIPVGKTDPIERGLRLFNEFVFYSYLCWKNRPDRKGIKTVVSL